MNPKVIGIIGGKGQMGTFFAEFFKQNNYSVIISDKETALSNKAVAKKADVVIVSVPIEVTEKVIKEVAHHVRKGALLMDLTSLKVFPVREMLKSKASVIGLHPLFGATNSIEGQVVVMCPARAGKWKNWLLKLLKVNRVILQELSAKAHDEMMAYVQVLTHFTDIALADTLKKAKVPISQFLKYQSPVYRLKLDMMGRILDQDPKLYGQIQILNPISKKVLNQFIESCLLLEKTVEAKDIKGFEKIFKTASSYLGDFCKSAMSESTLLIDIINSERKPLTPKSREGKGNIAVLGPKNTYSDIAVRKYNPQAKVQYFLTINEVFEAVQKGRVKEGFVPIENSSSGSVREALDELFAKNIWIEKVIAQPIRLALAANKKLKLKEVSFVYSHAQPLLQTHQFLKNQLSRAVAIPMSSTVAALERVAHRDQKGAAAIASPIAAKQHNLVIIKEGIEDDKSNTTYFAVIRKGVQKKVSPKAKKTSIAFTFDADSPGSLYSVLQDFADAGINLSKIESRPNPTLRGEYVFYLDFDGNTNQEKVKKTLQCVKKKVTKLRVLGSYLLN